MFSRLKSSGKKPKSAAKALGAAVATTPVAPEVDAREAAAIAQSIVLSVTRAKAKEKGNKGVQDLTLFADDTEEDVEEFIPSGFANVDAILGGGWPIGRCSEVSGKEASGKSALADMAIAQVCKMGGFAVIEEFEHTRTKERLAKMGADLSRVVIHSPDHAEAAWNNIWKVYQHILGLQEKKGKGGKTPPFLIVWDALGSCAANQEELDGTSKQPGRMGALMSRELTRMYKRIRRVRAHLMFVNQVRAVMGAKGPFAPKYEPTGGYAVRFAYTTRVECKAWAVPLNKYPKTGFCCRVTTRKNKVMPPFQSTTWQLDFADGPSPALTAFDLLREARVIKPSAEAGKMKCPILSAFNRAKWCQAFADPEFAKKAWALVTDKSAIKTELPTETEDEAGEED